MYPLSCLFQCNILQNYIIIARILILIRVNMKNISLTTRILYVAFLWPYLFPPALICSLTSGNYYLFSIATILPLQECYINRITQYVNFWN